MSSQMPRCSGLSAMRFRRQELSLGAESLAAAPARCGGRSKRRRAEVHRLTSAADCGKAVNPDGFRAQIEGGIVLAFAQRSMAKSRSPMVLWYTRTFPIIRWYILRIVQKSKCTFMTG